MTHFALFMKAMDLLQPGSCDAALEDAIVLFRVHVQWLLVNRRVLVDLVDGGLGRGAVRLRRCTRAHGRRKGVIEETILRCALLGGRRRARRLARRRVARGGSWLSAGGVILALLGVKRVAVEEVGALGAGEDFVVAVVSAGDGGRERTVELTVVLLISQ